ncbi:MAG: hypothetical protein AAGD86_00435 [Pseudomonadota bacterium]
MNARAPHSRLYLVGLLVALALLSAGCSTVTKSDAMKPPPLAVVPETYPEPVALLVSGEPRGIAVDNFRVALSEALLENRLFSAVEDNAPLLLEVRFNTVSQPLFGLSFTVDINSSWSLFRRPSQERLWVEPVSSTYSGGAEGGFVGANRLRRATEGAARELIGHGLDALSRADLP